MITNVLQNNKTLYIYDEDDQISAKIMLDENDFLGVGTDFFVLKKTYTMLTEDGTIFPLGKFQIKNRRRRNFRAR
ncbi:hypothetical protein [Capnocytophaga canimorsus]|uniref:Uncharacterized protein n=1 Tax=Capnocytophaga canimorsus (strain 5) TaxID=860228 RepID=F9YP94_CAPCC|nr:hypothetical protein [Capnocytophaga canimorsus]AEK23288.1 Hypothetical protein Ccan_11720 [Capnocytophaga canimorsus Cc5]GIM58914.1 hypothetical protein CAPN007_11220 [Capnocytophaga canimorsus]CEN48654.1 conserved hypothetical protein [Capnocytophaga canimorsus]VEJ18387.1 Uncharacterised protein [Capnocytophaga canimorsus]